MVSSRTVENQIRIREGFDVRVDPRSRRSLQPYLDICQKGSSQNWRVQEWKDKKFYPNYEGFSVAVLYGDGNEVPGNTLLRTVRESYYE
jgi:hypothetical protein